MLDALDIIPQGGIFCGLLPVIFLLLGYVYWDLWGTVGKPR